MPALSPASLQCDILRTYLGYEVVSPLGETLGELWNFAIDETTGELAYAIFQCGEKFHAFLWDEFHLCDQHTLQIMLTTELLDELPGLDLQQCPDWRGHRVCLLDATTLK